MNKSNFEEDAAKPAGDLKQVASMAEAMLIAEGKVKKAEETLKVLKAEYSQIESGDLPDLMDGIGLSEFVLTDGAKIKIKPVIKATLPTALGVAKQRDVDKREEMQTRLDDGLKYLRDHNADAIIQNTLVIDIAKGKDNIIGDLVGYLSKEYGLEVERNTSVNAQTLSAYVREKLNNGEDVPFETFSVFSGRKATITKARK